AAQAHLPFVREKIQGQLNQLREQDRKHESDRLVGEITEIGKRIATLDHRQKEEKSKQNDLKRELKVDPETPINAIPKRFSELIGVNGEDEETLRGDERDAKEAVNDNCSRRRAEADTHNVAETILELPAEKSELRRLERQRDVRLQAGVILNKARETIVDRVMPNTIHDMNRLLPLLTDSRYHQAEWDKDSSALSIYDNQARDYKRKTTFSGGARDQISLALRLAFAMATLPGEHAVRPGWLFLDEPLSSFDKQRTQALVTLLTKGPIWK
ncbi:MAG: hypothetical protein H7308_04285, partial [Chthonomonadaceae bacterium]|nr:hypothetical protein [Chthonomonadaceae bacterium]